MAGELWFIEAPGKAAQLQAMLAKLGRTTRVQATKGHFMSMPRTLDPIGIDSAFHDFSREPSDAERFARMREMAREADQVFIATDADSEGDVIAWDVAQAIADIHTDPVRVRLKGVDAESLQEAIDAATPVSKADAVPGRTRAIVDRLIGAAFSGNGVVVGRVGTAMLGLIQRTKPSVYRLELVAPAKDGGRPWRASVDVRPPMTADYARTIAGLDLPALDFSTAKDSTTAPNHMGDIMLRAAERLDLSPAQTARAMQRSYETGRLSYPRSGSRGVSRGTARRLRKMMRGEGFKFDEANVTIKDEKQVHDAPHPIGDVSLTHDPRQLGADEGVRTMIGRDLVRAGQVIVVESPATGAIRDCLLRAGLPQPVAELVASLPWRRERGPAAPGTEAWSESQVVQRRPDAVLLQACIDAGLGKPSTWGEHVEKFLSRGLVDDELMLTDKGRKWLEASPKELLNPALSVAIERACDNGHPRMHQADGEPWEFLARKIVEVLPPGIKAPLAALVSDTAPMERRNFLGEADKLLASLTTADTQTTQQVDIPQSLRTRQAPANTAH